MVADKDTPVPDTILHATTVSLLHSVQRHEEDPILEVCEYDSMPMCKPLINKTAWPVAGAFETVMLDTMGLANEKAFVNVETCWLEFT